MQVATSRPAGGGFRYPAHLIFVVSAVFHYIGPAFAVLLFARVDVVGVAWLRIASAAAAFACWRRPWDTLRTCSPRGRAFVLAFGCVLAAMNVCFYFAIARLPLGTVGAIEFLGPIILAVMGVRSKRNTAALALAVAGVYLLTDVQFVQHSIGYVFAFANFALFTLYILLGHRIAESGAGTGIGILGAAMSVALVAVTPIGVVKAALAFTNARILLAGAGIGICSSVVPYVCDQLAMARLPRATFALMLSLLPLTATLIGITVLRQLPSAHDVCGIALVAAGIALHRPANAL